MMAGHTGNTTTSMCPDCAQSIRSRELVHMDAQRTKHWSRDEHVAKCGSPCIGGPIRGKYVHIYKKHECHGQSAHRCPS